MDDIGASARMARMKINIRHPGVLVYGGHGGTNIKGHAHTVSLRRWRLILACDLLYAVATLLRSLKCACITVGAREGFQLAVV